MHTTPDQLRQWLIQPEGTRLEFKEAKTRYDFDKLMQYCVALANEGGGKIVLGVTDRRPRQIVGTAAFDEPGRTEAGELGPAEGEPQEGGAQSLHAPHGGAEEAVARRGDRLRLGEVLENRRPGTSGHRRGHRCSRARRDRLVRNRTMVRLA